MNISNILSSVGVPVARLNYSGPETSYVTFFEYNQYSALDADDEEKATHLSFQVNVYSKGNYLSLVEEVKKLMKAAGYRRVFETEEYEDGTGYFHKVIRYHYYKEEF